jgi:hypothetical protein
MARLSDLKVAERRRLLQQMTQGGHPAGPGEPLLREALLALSAKADSRWFLEQLLQPEGHRLPQNAFQKWGRTAIKEWLADDHEAALELSQNYRKSRQADQSLPEMRWDFLILEGLIAQGAHESAVRHFDEEGHGLGGLWPRETLRFETFEALAKFQQALLRESRSPDEQLLGTMGFLGGKAFDLGGKAAVIVFMDQLAKKLGSGPRFEEVLTHHHFLLALIKPEGGKAFFEVTTKHLSAERARRARAALLSVWQAHDRPGLTAWAAHLPEGRRRAELLRVLENDDRQRLPQK